VNWARNAWERDPLNRPTGVAGRPQWVGDMEAATGLCWYLRRTVWI
jgi:hypothetical protein